MTLGLFLIGGTVLLLLKSDKVSDFSRVFGKLPYTTIALILVFLSIVGVPPTSGFFSKFYLIKGAFQMGQYQFIIALLLSSLTSLFIFFRFFESYFYQKSEPDLDALKLSEPFVFKVSLMITSALILFLGLSYNYWFQYIINIIPLGLR